MTRFRWMSIVPVAALLAFASVPAAASSVRDRAGIFSPAAVSKVESELDRIEQRTGVPVIIETVESLPGVGRDASPKARSQAVEDAAEKRAREIGYEGVYLLISKNDKVFSPVLVRKHLDSRLPRQKRLAIRDALNDEFKGGRFDQGLARVAQLLDRDLSSTAGRAEAPRGVAGVPVQQRGHNPGVGFGIGTLVMIALGIFGILLLFRVLGSAFGRSAGGYPGPGGPTGYPGPGMGGPGYGGPGYGGYGAPRGGFFSGMLGGLGGALAGNWLYDQFSGRHGGHHTDAGTYYPTESATSPDPAGEGFVGGDDTPGGGTSWEDTGGGGDWGGGGGDWGGGDGGGGGDWGGGGGDWGGGGGDWGGGGGGDGGGW